MPDAPRHTAVVDLGFGDAGKGTVVDHLCARARDTADPVRAVVRFNGGAQAAHNVVTDDGRHHTFAQWGSGTFTPGVETHLSRFMIVDPLALTAEGAHLAAVGVPRPFDRLTVHRDALLTTPYHAAANRVRELARGAARHGSCGMGVGETAAFAARFPDEAIRARDCLDPRLLRTRLRTLLDALRAEGIAGIGAAADTDAAVYTDDIAAAADTAAADTAAGDAAPLGSGHPQGPRRATPLDLGSVPDIDACVDAFAAFGRAVRLVDDAHTVRLLRRGRVVFEGAQGVLLDEWHGFHPYTTWSTTTFANAETLLADAGLAAGSALRLGVVRTYTPRHGPGPLVTEDAAATAALPDRHNDTGRWQGAFRVGHFDAVAHRYAVEVCGGVDALAVTHLDAPERFPLVLCRAYELDGGRLDRLPVGRRGDLAGQERLTARLMRAAPVLEPVPVAADTPSPWPEIVSAALGAPVSLLSSGPRTGDKAGPAVLLSSNK
ncbi:adenylosuccinate synthetase [Yinghuangia seranimata]|uniref:adenylosuccinate synthetase n=1 Tax=Yinghuangia seranimata TaxID=408067 RepID=UPI00248D20D3|nr:adenylosuccinate synthetase [Yinghuangia seranimata]MDI2131544.1 adenylosuccinate synthetase [Yinghuangia seranimata]